MRQKRTRFFLAVEGRSEQSFVKWLQVLADQKGLSIHLECHVLNGGGFAIMLNRAMIFHKRGKGRGPYKASFLLVDVDREKSGDLSINDFKQKASSEGLTVCCQRPNFEGLLLRMLRGEEGIPNNALAELKRKWPEYKKPADANTLERKFTLQNLMGVAASEPDLRELLKGIGLINWRK